MSGKCGDEGVSSRRSKNRRCVHRFIHVWVPRGNSQQIPYRSLPPFFILLHRLRRYTIAHPTSVPTLMPPSRRSHPSAIGAPTILLTPRQLIPSLPPLIINFNIDLFLAPTNPHNSPNTT